MKTVLFLSLILISQIVYGQKLKITLYNKTGYDLDSVYIQTTYVGSIKKDMSVVVLNCNEVTMQAGRPYGLPRGIIRGQKRNDELIGLCGTGRLSVDSGAYKFDITSNEDGQGYRLWWAEHK